MAYKCWPPCSWPHAGNGFLSVRGKNALVPSWGILNALSKQWPPLMISKRGNEPPINYNTWLGYLNCWISSKSSSADSPTSCVWFNGPYSHAALHTSCFTYILFAVTQLPLHKQEHRFPPRHSALVIAQLFLGRFFFPWNANAFLMKTNTGLWLTVLPLLSFISNETEMQLQSHWSNGWLSKGAFASDNMRDHLYRKVFRNF